jgi:hypothetical protein
MARMNLKDEKLVKQKWFLKKLKLMEGGKGLHSTSIFPCSF